jgi:MFS family permease
LLGLAFVHNLYPALLLLLVVGLGFVGQNVQANTLVQMLSPDEIRGRVTSVYSLMFFGTAPFGSLLAGAVAQAIGSSLAIALAAVVSLLFAFGIAIFAPQVRRS